MRNDIQRREVAYDATDRTLTVGGRTTVLGCRPGDNECLLRTYLDLVAEQREVTLNNGVRLRRDDVAVLAELLDLDDADLETRLRRILRLSGTEAADLHRKLLRQRVVAAAVGVGLFVAVPAAAVAGADEAADPTPSSNSTHSTTSTTAAVAPTHPTSPQKLAPVIPLHPTSPAAPVVVEAEPAPQAPAPLAAVPDPEPEVEVGYTVTYERDPNFVAPEGVDIGESMVIQRDLPPAD